MALKSRLGMTPEQMEKFEQERRMRDALRRYRDMIDLYLRDELDGPPHFIFKQQDLNGDFEHLIFIMPIEYRSDEELPYTRTIYMPPWYLPESDE